MLSRGLVITPLVVATSEPIIPSAEIEGIKSNAPKSPYFFISTDFEKVIQHSCLSNYQIAFLEQLFLQVEGLHNPELQWRLASGC